VSPSIRTIIRNIENHDEKLAYFSSVRFHAFGLLVLICALINSNETKETLAPNVQVINQETAGNNLFRSMIFYYRNGGQERIFSAHRTENLLDTPDQYCTYFLICFVQYTRARF